MRFSLTENLQQAEKCLPIEKYSNLALIFDFCAWPRRRQPEKVNVPIVIGQRTMTTKWPKWLLLSCGDLIR